VNASMAQQSLSPVRDNDGLAGSVYDTIKKELLSLRLETSTLSKSLAATATVANITALTRRHDATIKRVSAVSNRVNELEQVLAGLQLALAEAARAQERLQREVCAACTHFTSTHRHLACTTQLVKGTIDLLAA
jgi:hypothetical protein